MTTKQLTQESKIRSRFTAKASDTIPAGFTKDTWGDVVVAACENSRLCNITDSDQRTFLWGVA